MSPPWNDWTTAWLCIAVNKNDSFPTTNHWRQLLFAWFPEQSQTRASPGELEWRRQNVSFFDPNPCSLRDIGVAKKPWQVQTVQARRHKHPPPLTIVHPPPDWALGEWVPVLCLDELIGKRCAAAPHRLSCPHQDADLDNTPRCSRTNPPGVARVWWRLENSFVWGEGLKNEVHEAKSNSNCPAHNIALLHLLSLVFSYEWCPSRGSANSPWGPQPLEQ